ncbi:MAG: hypothetical protein GYA62_03445 [Bacteroidales bacterium]|nr:hypothetical protein [Bacteroidales bacterium]
MINGEIDISTNDIGEKKCEFIIASKDGFITIHKNLNYIVYNLSIVSPTEKYYKNANNLNDIKLNNSYINYAFCFEENRNCDILCRLKIEPDTEELRKAFEGKIHGSLEEIAYGNDKLTLTWNDQITVGSEKRGKFAYDAGKGEWVATSTYSGLPAPPPKSYGRVPRNMKKLLYGKRKAAIIAPEFESEYNYNTTYEIYYGNNFKISDVEVIYITKNENILKNIFSDFNDDNMTIVEEIYEKMICSTGSFNFSNMKELSDNIKMRILAIKYINKVAVADPSFRVFGFDGNGLARAGDCYYDILMKKWINGKYWRAYNTSDKRNKRFLSYSDKSAYDSIMNIFPYHGECLGSMSICVILSSANVIGKNDFDNIYNNISISIGFWWSKDLSIHFKTPSDTDTYLPGDHLYMKNYDNYIDVHPNGAWQGENTLYIRNNFNGVMGDGVFSGQGVKEYTEDRLYNKLLEEYRKGTGAITIPLGNIEFINHKMINTGKKY